MKTLTSKVLWIGFALALVFSLGAFALTAAEIARTGLIVRQNQTVLSHLLADERARGVFYAHVEHEIDAICALTSKCVP